MRDGLKVTEQRPLTISKIASMRAIDAPRPTAKGQLLSGVSRNKLTPWLKETPQQWQAYGQSLCGDEKSKFFLLNTVLPHIG